MIERDGRVLWCAGAAGCLMMLSVTAAATAGEFNRFIVYGDSLSDVGNVHIATGGGIPTSPPYFNGRFSNGPVWVEHLAEIEGISVPQPALAGGTNFAFGGASTGDRAAEMPATPGVSGVGSPNLDTQIGMYLSSGLTPQADDLFIVWAGANDFLIEGEDNAAEAVGRLTGALGGLAASGAQHILVLNLPDLTRIPNADQPPSGFVLTPNDLGTRTAGYNALLDDALDDMATLFPAVTLHRYDAAGLLDRIVADPAAFGLTNVTDPAFDGMTIVPNPDEYLWWDMVHVSGAVHRIIAEEVSTLIPEPGTAMIVAGALLLVGSRRPRQSRMTRSQ